MTSAEPTPFLRTPSGEHYATLGLGLLWLVLPRNTEEGPGQKGEGAAKSADLWISPDPARQYHSPYSYGPNPVNGVDPDGSVWKTINESSSNQILSFLFNVPSFLARVQGPTRSNGEKTYKWGFRGDRKSANLGVKTVVQRWEHSASVPDEVNHLHPSGTHRTFTETMHSMSEVLEALKDIEGSNSFLYSSGKSMDWYPPIPDMTYWEMPNASHTLNGNSISPFTPSNPHVEVGPVDICSGCE